MNLASVFPLVLGLILFSGCASASGTTSSGGPEVRFIVSKPHGLLNFVQAQAGDYRRAPGLREVFKGSRFDDAVHRAWLDEFERMQPTLKSFLAWPGYPASRGMGQTVDTLILAQGAFAKDLDDLSDRTLGMLSMSEHHRLFTILRGMLPAYEELVWNVSEKPLLTYRDRIQELSRKWGMNGLFRKARAFYRADWPEDLPFTVVLYPLPGGKGHSNAESLGTLESVGIFPSESEFDVRFGITFHEMCHSLYDAQPAAVQREFEQAFLQSGSKHAPLAYQWINEGLATSLGNGLAFEAATGHLDPGSWYANPQVNGFGHALVDVVRPYFESSKPWDPAWVSASIGKLETAFPEAPFEFAPLLLGNTIVLVDGAGIQSQAAGKALRQAFRIQSMSRNSPIDAPESRASVEEAGPGSVMLVIATEKEAPQLKAFSVLAPLQGVKAPALFAAYGPDHRPWIALKLENGAQLPSAIAELKRIGKIDPRNPVRKLSL